MARAYHVDGPVLISTGTGAAAALEPLGISEDGVDISINFYQEPVYSDAAGPRSPVDLQDFGADANIQLRLKDYDTAILQKLRALAMGDIDEGEAGNPGRLVATSGGTYRLVLTSVDEPWRFTYVTLRNAHRMKLGTKSKSPQCEFYAFRPVPAGTNTVSGIKLYDHVAA